MAAAKPSPSSSPSSRLPQPAAQVSPGAVQPGTVQPGAIQPGAVQPGALHLRGGLDEPVSALVQPTRTLDADTVNAEELDRIFKADEDLDCLVFVHGGRPCALITRHHYYIKTGGPFGYTLYQKRRADLLAKAGALIVDAGTTIRTLARLAHERQRDDQYDPVIVTTTGGELLGIVTINQLVKRTSELEVQTAQLANPLTQLPGSLMVQSWITAALADGGDGLTVVYADLAAFQEFNRAYGFLRGDELIRCTAQVLQAELGAGPGDVQLGHLGGDNFALVGSQPLADALLHGICRRFDREKLAFFASDELASGFLAGSRAAGGGRVPLINLVLVAIRAAHLGSERHPAAFAQAAASLGATARALALALGLSCFVSSEWLHEARLARQASRGGVPVAG